MKIPNVTLIHDGNLFDIEIPIEKMKIFLSENRELMNLLTLKHIEKIKWFEQNG